MLLTFIKVPLHLCLTNPEKLKEFIPISFYGQTLSKSPHQLLSPWVWLDSAEDIQRFGASTDSEVVYCAARAGDADVTRSTGAMGESFTKTICFQYPQLHHCVFFLNPAFPSVKQTSEANEAPLHNTKSVKST